MVSCKSIITPLPSCIGGITLLEIRVEIWQDGTTIKPIEDCCLYEDNDNPPHQL